MTTNISSIFLTALHTGQISNETLVSQTQWIHAIWPGNQEIVEIGNLYYLQVQEKRIYRMKILEHQLRRENKKTY